MDPRLNEFARRLFRRPRIARGGGFSSHIQLRFEESLPVDFEALDASVVPQGTTRKIVGIVSTAIARTGFDPRSYDSPLMLRIMPDGRFALFAQRGGTVLTIAVEDWGDLPRYLFEP